ncbi:temperature dependent protein affecting M2 dsRNA replication-domain-containing protein [Coprinopsis sp. MPI-PUGE-AT-0042]|nr:temperature dependent protein affecting M2 dsRNA replication-domain-containing protein [Coprinopsis sp. MPI-PUGE-AT-0042]
MPIKHLEVKKQVSYHLSQQKHIQTLPLSVLSETRLGIDASHYIQYLLDAPASREPLLAATGGLPLALTTRIEADLRVLEKLNIKPVFVFPGMPPNKQSAEACKDRRDAWNKYESGQEEAATKLMILRIFRHRNVEFIVAPYLAWAQVITHIDLTSPNPSFQFVSKRSVLQELAVNEDQFLDICILVGFDHSPAFPPTIHEQALKATVDMVKYYKTGFAAVSAFSEHPAVKAIQYPRPFRSHANPPLDNGETTEYKRFVKEVITDAKPVPVQPGLFWFDQPPMPPMQQQPGQPPQPPPQHQHKPIAHNSQQTLQLVERVGGWNVPYGIIEEELRRQNSSTIDFALCLGATATDRLAARTKVKSPTSAPLEKKDESVANVIWRFLELRGFLLNTHTHSALARAMHTAIKQAKLNDKFQDPLYLFLELVRAGVMHGHLWSGRAFSGGPSFGGDEEKASMLLVMRVLSIVPLNFKPQPWSAPLSRELLVFNSFVRSLTRALRTLLEVTSLNLLLRNDARKARDDLLDIALSLPFQTEVNTGFGVLAKVYLDALTHINGGVRVTDGNAEGVKDMKELALEICEETFLGVKSPRAEVERGFRFWDVALTAMRQLHSEGAVLRELIDQFEAAEAWLAPMRP